MSEVIITVRGNSETRLAPERAVAHVTAKADGPERAAVIARIAQVADPVRQELDAAKSASTVTEWHSQRMSVWADRPWNDRGEQLPLVHHAALEITATFTDVAALSDWLNAASTRDGLSVGTIDWQLSPETRARVEREVATQAVAVAVERATSYAKAIGHESVEPVEIADLGLLGGGDSAPVQPVMAFARSGKSVGDSLEGASAADFRPDEIVVSAGVEARFRAV